MILHIHVDLFLRSGAPARLGEFANASSISSAQYFERDEAPKEFDSSLTAGDLAERFAAQALEDIDHATASFWERAAQIREAAQNAMRNLGDA
jgi:hypothetical protein